VADKFNVDSAYTCGIIIIIITVSSTIEILLALKSRV